jgi:hypothetical protein
LDVGLTPHPEKFTAKKPWRKPRPTKGSSARNEEEELFTAF